MIQRFLDAISSRSLEIVHVDERMVSSTLSSSDDKEAKSKAWDPHREDYDPKERRKWVVWIVLRWSRQDAK